MHKTQLINIQKGYSLLMHRFKIKSPANFLWNEQNVFGSGFILFQSAFTLVVLQWQKSLPDIGGNPFHDVGPLAPMEPGIHTMSNEFILQISCNIFLAFKWMLMMRSGHNISHYTTAKLSVHVTWPDLMLKQNWYTKTFPQHYDYELLNPK